MNDNLILIFSILASGVIGFFIGNTISKLKSKSDKSALEERQNQSNNTIETLKKAIGNLERERDMFRDEREGLNIELAQKNVAFENLEQQK